MTENARDVIALQVVTRGRRASEAAREWFAQNRYQDYLYLRGLSVEMGEAEPTRGKHRRDSKDEER